MGESDDELRGRVDAEGGSKRYRNSEKARTPEEVDDPTTSRDGTTPTLWGRAKQNYLYFLTLLLAGIAGLVVAAAFGVQLVPELLANKLLLGVIGLAILLTIVYVLATKAAYGRLVNVWWFVGISGTSIHFYVGEYVSGGPDENGRFQPHKGFSLFGHKREPYTVEEIDPDAAQTWKYPTVDGDDPAEINIDEAPGGEIRTDYGGIVAQWMGGIEPQRHGEAQLRLLPPDEVDPSYSGTHWYLREPGDGRFVDLGLAADYPVECPPFEMGRRRAFMTGDEPSQRTKQVLRGLEVLE